MVRLLGARYDVAWIVVIVTAALLAIPGAVLGGWGGWLDVLAWIAACVTALTLGLAGVTHAVALRRMQRVKVHDLGIVVLGLAALAVVLAALVFGARQPVASTALLQLGWILWEPGLAVTAYLVHALASRPRRVEGRWATIVVLGGALKGRVVGPLLRRRVDRAAQRWHELDAPRPRIVVAGGQGSDEPRSEAEAMAEHLVLVCDVPEGMIDLEDASTSTEENLRFARDHVGAREPWLVVTSEYHVPRTRVLLAKLGIAGDAEGSWSSPMYRPGALVRELAATLRPARPLLLVHGLVGAAVVLVGLVRAWQLLGVL